MSVAAEKASSTHPCHPQPFRPPWSLGVLRWAKGMTSPDLPHFLSPSLLFLQETNLPRGPAVQGFCLAPLPQVLRCQDYKWCPERAQEELGHDSSAGECRLVAEGTGPYTDDSKIGKQKQVSQDPCKHHPLPTSALEDPPHRQWPQDLNL